MKPLNLNAVLCYVESGFAYFTTQNLKEQTGDDWDDAPYEYNAGTPYGPCESAVTIRKLAGDCRIVRVREPKPNPLDDVVEISDFDEEGNPKWIIIKIAFEGPFETPRECNSNSPFSVDRINAGAIAWLRSNGWIKKSINIPAGTTLGTFIELVKKADGRIYAEI